MLASAGNAGTTKDTQPSSTGRLLTWSFTKGSIPGFDHELRNLESAHCGNSKPTFASSSSFFFDIFLGDVGLFNMST